jgi:hypothetical protein
MGMAHTSQDGVRQSSSNDEEHFPQNEFCGAMSLSPQTGQRGG